MKYVLVLPDGVSDVALPELDGRTPLEAANHPNMDWIASNGVCGWSRTIPQGMSPGSDVGCMSVFGYDPRVYFTGRAPLEASAKGISIADDEVAFRCNTVTVKDNVMVDYSAGHIETEESSILIKEIDNRLGNKDIRFFPGVGYRHLTLLKGIELAKVKCTPPHDIAGKNIEPYLPKGSGSDLLKELMQKSKDILADHSVNKERARSKKEIANMIWFWGQGRSAKLPSFKEQYGLSSACISAVDIVRGLGRLLGFEIIQVPGITGYFDTDYKAKADYALKALDKYDFVLVHVEPTDEAGHMGDAKLKIKAIEDTDRLVVGTLLEGLKKRNEKFAILLTPDHPTSTILKTHIPEPVPFAVYSPGMQEDGIQSYNERAIRGSSVCFENGFELMSFFLKCGGTH